MHASPSPSQGPTRPGGPASSVDSASEVPAAEPKVDSASMEPAEPTLEESPAEPTPEVSMDRLRHLQTERRPVRVLQNVSTIEQRDADLAEALALLAVWPTASNYRAVGDHYRRLGLLDKAYEHYSEAVLLNRYDARAYESLARVWRDWGLTHFGLVEAHRAVFYAPLAASAHNTLGTILQALGQREAARSEYQRALDLDSGAAYALNNLCYASFLDGRFTQAIEECSVALAVEPDLIPARNNLALVYAARGLDGRAEEEFATAAGLGAAAYNMGMVHLAERRYGAAVSAFQKAERVQPLLTDAPERWRQAQRLARRNGWR